MANAQNLGRQLGWSKLAVDGVIEEMKLGDYEHLVQTFDKHFGTVVTLETSNQEYLRAMGWFSPFRH